MIFGKLNVFRVRDNDIFGGRKHENKEWEVLFLAICEVYSVKIFCYAPRQPMVALRLDDIKPSIT